MPWVNPRKEGNPTIDSFQEASFRPRSLNFLGNFVVGLTKGAATVLGRRSCAVYEHRAKGKETRENLDSDSPNEEQELGECMPDQLSV